MRLIETTKSHVVLKETHDVSGELISMQGYEYGALHYKISNGKISFYLNDLDNPWKCEVWSVNMPVMVDGVLKDADTIEAALASVMADKWQEQIDALDVDLDAEIERAQAEEQRIEHQFDDRFEALNDKDAELEESIDDEIERAISAETFIYNYSSGVGASLASEITRSVAEDARLNQAILDETARAVSAETRIEHQFDNEFAALEAADAALNQAILDETARAISAETTLNGAIANETFRAQTIENTISGAIDSIDSAVQGEITRATAKDAVHDTLISALTSDLLAEAARATSAETALSASINAEVLRATNAETALSANTYTKAEVNDALALKADKASAFTSVEYDHNDKRIYFKANGTLVGQVNTTDFVKDGMVSNAVISGNNLVITFNTDAGKEDIVVSLRDIFDPSNYYDKSVMDILLGQKQDVSGMSAYALTANTYTKSDVDTAINAATSGKADTSVVETLSGKVETLSGDTYSKQESDARYTLTSTTSALNSAVTAHTADGSIHVTSSDKSAWSAKQDALVSGSNIKTINGESVLGSGNIVVSSTDSYTKQESDTKYQPQSGMSSYTLTSTTNSLSGVVTAHTADTTAHVTQADKNTWSAKSDFSGSYNDLTNKPTIPTIWSGTQAQFDLITTKDPNTIYLISD